MARRFPFWVALSLLAAWLPLSNARAQGSQVVYSNTLQNGWSSSGWATLNFNCTSPVLTGCADSISVTSSNYGALYLHQTAFDSSTYTNLTFWIYGGSAGGQPLQVQATLNGTPQTPVMLSPLTANWQQVTVSLAALGAANQPDMDGFWIQSRIQAQLAPFYVDNIVLTAGAPSVANPTNFIGIDVASNRNPISSLIYGTAFATSNQLADLNFTMNRSGGNEETTYNWQINAHGKGADYYFESYPDDSATAGQSADSVIANSKTGGAQPLITIPMIGWTPILGANRAILPSYSVSKYGPQTAADPYRTNDGNGVSVTNNTPITWNNPTDAYMAVTTNYQFGYINHLTNTWGNSTNGGVGYYIMDNEHSLWFSTHQDIHPIGPSMQEIFSKMTAYATLVKSMDPHALVLGPEEWGWPGYFYSGYDQQWSGQHNDYNAADYPDRKTNGGWDYAPWLLNQFHQYNITNGQRLLDYFTLHCYPQEGSVSSQTDVSSATSLLRNQSTRQFWDTNYVDPSWINSIIMLIPRMQKWVSTNYPGTKIGITEYNWGAEGYMNGATAQADILGIFGRQGLDLATRWTTPATGTPTYLAMKMYRNYDSRGHTFGDISVSATGPNPDNIAVFAAQRSTDAALTIMVVNKNMTGTAPLIVNLTHFIGNGIAQVWQLNSSNVIASLTNVSYTAGLLQTAVPGPSVTLFVLPPSSLRLAAGAPRSGGQFAFTVSGDIGQSFTLQTSTDLTHWAPVSTNTLTATNATFTLTASQSTEFYRAAGK